MVNKSDSKPLKKPSPVVVGRVSAYAVRGPSASDDRWYWQAKGPTIDGKRPTLWSGRATPAELIQQLAGIVLEHGDEPQADKIRAARELAEGLTVASLLAHWKAHVDATPDKYAANTRRNYAGQARRLTKDLGGYTVDELRPATLEQYHSRRIRQGARKSTVDLSLRVLRTAWNWGLRNRFIHEPWPKPSLRLRDGADRKRPTMEEVNKVLVVLGQKAPPWCYRLALIVARTGMRVSEAWGLLVDDVVLERRGREVIGGHLRIRTQEGVAKTGGRLVYGSTDLMTEVAGWIKDRGEKERLIGKITQGTATMGAATYLRPAVQEIGGDWTGWHSFRRAAADAYAVAGVDAVAAAQQLGHTVQVMQSVYRSVRPAQAQAAAAALGAVQKEAPMLRVVEEG